MTTAQVAEAAPGTPAPPAGGARIELVVSSPRSRRYQAAQPILLSELPEQPHGRAHSRSPDLRRVYQHRARRRPENATLRPPANPQLLTISRVRRRSARTVMGFTMLLASRAEDGHQAFLMAGAVPGSVAAPH